MKGLSAHNKKTASQRSFCYKVRDSLFASTRE